MLILSFLIFLTAARESIWLEREERARQHYEKHLEERRKKLEEQRLKEERRRAAVEEKRRQRIEEDKVRINVIDTLQLAFTIRHGTIQLFL